MVGTAVKKLKPWKWWIVRLLDYLGKTHMLKSLAQTPSMVIPKQRLLPCSLTALILKFSFM